MSTNNSISDFDFFDNVSFESLSNNLSKSKKKTRIEINKKHYLKRKEKMSSKNSKEDHKRKNTSDNLSQEDIEYSTFDELDKEMETLLESQINTYVANLVREKLDNTNLKVIIKDLLKAENIADNADKKASLAKVAIDKYLLMKRKLDNDYGYMTKDITTSDKTFIDSTVEKNSYTSKSDYKLSTNDLNNLAVSFELRLKAIKYEIARRNKEPHLIALKTVHDLLINL
jgi:subtilase family serine protease